MPDPQTLEADVVAILKRVSRRPIEPTLESELTSDLGFDSLTVLELIAELEDHFDVRIPSDATLPVGTVSQVCDYLGALLTSRETPLFPAPDPGAGTTSSSE